MPTELLIAAQATTSEPVYTDGAVVPLSTNVDGRLRVASKPGYFPPSTADLTSVSQVLVVDVTDASNIVAHVRNVGSAAMAAGTFVFEGSIDSTDGTDGSWFSVQGCRSDSNIIETSRPTSSLAAGTGQAYAWEFSVNAIRWFRIRCSVSPTASSIARWTAIRGTYATEPIPAIQTHAVTQSGAFTVTPVTPTAYVFETGAPAVTLASIKASAGNLYEISVFNPSAAAVFVKLYNKASAPVVATDTPFMTIPVAAGELRALEFGFTGKRCTAGIAIAITGAASKADSTNAGTGVQVNANYI